MNVCEDYFKLCLERIKIINTLNNMLKEEKVILSNKDFCSLFIISKDTYNKKIMSSLDRSFIKSQINSNEIELDHNNLIKILDIAVTSRVDAELNKELVYKIFDYCNIINNNELNIENINSSLETIK